MRDSTKGLIIGATLGFAAAVVLFRSVPASDVKDTAHTAAVPAARFAAIGSAAAALSDADKQSLRQLIRDEIRSTSGSGSGASDSSPAPTAKAELEQLTGPALEHYQRVHDKLDGAMRSRTWTMSDRSAMRPELGQIPTELRQQLIAQLIDAVNRGEVKWEGRGAVF